MTKRILLTAVVLGLALSVTGCLNRGPAKPPATVAPNTALSGTLHVFVPCGVAGPYGEIMRLFQARYPNVKMTPHIANIDVQTKLVKAGKASADVWLALGDREMQQAMKAGKIDGQPVTFAYNSIALMVAKNNPLGIESVTDLLKPSVHTIALPTESNSSGYYVKQAFIKAGVWDKIQLKLWITDQPSNVKLQLSTFKAEVGVVYYPCTREASIGDKPQELPGKLQLLGKIPETLAGRIPAQAAVIRDSANPAAGRAFLHLLLEDQVQDIWEKWAFDRATQPASGPRTTLYVYCGAGIRPMMDTAVAAFEKKNPQVRLDVGYAGSGCLLSQLAFSRRGDLYMPGEEFYMTQAVQRNYIASQKPAGYFEPVLLVQKGNPKNIRTVADLTRPGMRVGLGEPQAAAVGIAADALLKQAGVYEKVQPNVKTRAGNVPELANFVKLKQLDASIVWNVTAGLVASSCDIVPIDRKLYKPSLAPIGLLKFSKSVPQAQAFIDFLTGPAGQAIVAKSGMAPATKAGR